MDDISDLQLQPTSGSYSHNAVKMTFTGIKDGLGIRIVGGRKASDEKDFGIFIKEILPHRFAAQDGRLQTGDQLLEVNGRSLVGVSNESAVRILRDCASNSVIQLLVARDAATQMEFKRLSTSLQITPQGTYSKKQDSDLLPSTPEIKRTSASSSVSDLTQVSEIVSDSSSSHKTGNGDNSLDHGIKLGDVVLSSMVGKLSDDDLPPPLPTSPPPAEPLDEVHEKEPMSVSDPQAEFMFVPPTAYGNTAKSAASSSKIMLSRPSTHEQVTQQLTSSPTAEVADKSHQRPRKRDPCIDPYHQRLSMDLGHKVKLSKLEWALSYIGKPLTEDQMKKLRSTLDVDSNGKVMLSQFITAVQNVLAYRLGTTQIQTELLMALTEKIPMDHTPYTERMPSFSDYRMKPGNQPSVISTTSTDLKVSKESESVGMTQMVHSAGVQEEAKEGLHSESGLEVELLKKKLMMAQEETAMLKAQLQRKSASQHEMEDMITALREKQRLKEAELDVLKNRQVESTSSDLHRCLAVRDCELKKCQASIRRYQVAVEKLMQCNEKLHDAFVNSQKDYGMLYHCQGKGESVVRGDPVRGNPRPPPYLSRHAKLTSSKLSQEAKETSAAVRKILDYEDLPYGWEEKHTGDGRIYYIHHQKQVTTWKRPSSNHTPTSIAFSPASN